MNNAQKLLEPIKLGSLTIENRLLQAPLAGYSNLPFRLMCQRCGGPGLLATEMISAEALRRGCAKTTLYAEKHGEEKHVQYQLWGTDPQAISEAAKICVDRGADAIDLNCGCPVKKVNAAGAGVVIMNNPELIGKCVEAMRTAVTVPVSIKIRVGPTAKKPNGLEVAKIAEASGADFITVHGRHGKEAYCAPVRYEMIAEIVDALDIPVIGNGNIFDGASATEMMEKTGCAGVMVARGCMGNPWVFDRIKTEVAGKVWMPPTTQERGKVMLDNYHMLVGIMGEDRATRHIRKLACFYSKGIVGSREFRVEANHCRTADDFQALVEKHFFKSMLTGE